MLTVEVGGSSIQAIQFADSSHGRIVPLHQHRTDRWLLAAPGLVEGNRVRGAHHLGWMDVQASDELGMSSPPLLSMNDAEAAALGEWVLCRQPNETLLYIVMGTGVGAVAVANGAVIPVEFGHLTAFGPKRCGGCGRIGCLDAQIGGHTLPHPLSDQDVDTIVAILDEAFARQEIAFDRVVVGGGIPRSYRRIVSGLGERIEPPTYPSGCPDGYKSAAPFGLLHAWQTR